MRATASSVVPMTVLAALIHADEGGRIAGIEKPHAVLGLRF